MLSLTVRRSVSHGEPLTQSLPPQTALRWLAAFLSLGAAALHFAVAPEHFAEFAAFGWFFVIVAWMQAAWALTEVSTPRRWLLDAGILGNAGLVGLWLWTRVVAVPIGPGAGTAESFGAVDIVTALLEVGTLLACLGALELVRLNRRIPIAAIFAATVVVVATIGLVLAHDQVRTPDAGATSSEAGTHVGH
jgi:hypothetical protein